MHERTVGRDPARLVRVCVWPDRSVCATSRGLVMAENRGRRAFSIALLATAVLSACFFAAAPARAASTASAAYPYYVEFRVAVDGVYGHSYVAYGRLNSLGRPETATYADIHPTGDVPSMVLGHFFPMEAATVPEKDTLGYKIATRFRRPLTAAEYHRLKLVIARIRALHHSWSVLAYNCNDFVADVARGMGMQTPTTLSLPYDFIPRLQAINDRALRPTSSLASAPVMEIRRSDQSAVKKISLAGSDAPPSNSLRCTMDALKRSTAGLNADLNRGPLCATTTDTSAVVTTSQTARASP
jgi:hypothetical protein